MCLWWFQEVANRVHAPPPKLDSLKYVYVMYIKINIEFSIILVGSSLQLLTKV